MTVTIFCCRGSSSSTYCGDYMAIKTNHTLIIHASDANAIAEVGL